MTKAHTDKPKKHVKLQVILVRVTPADAEMRLARAVNLLVYSPKQQSFTTTSAADNEKRREISDN